MQDHRTPNNRRNASLGATAARHLRLCSRLLAGPLPVTKGLAAALLGSALLACAAAPLPNENPAQYPNERAPVVNVIVDSPDGALKSRVAELAGIGLQQPAAVVYDAKTDHYLVSNTNGSPFVSDNNGFITKLGADGRIVEFEFISGGKNGVTLNAPVGMAIVARTLYVVDQNTLRAFDLDSGKAQESIVIDGASSLLGITAMPDRSLWLADAGMAAAPDGFAKTGTDAIYRVDAARATTKLAAGTDLGMPSALLANATGAWVVGFGSGELYHVSNDGKQASRQQLPHGELAGLSALKDGSLLISSWAGSCIYRGLPGAKFEKFLGDLTTPAALGVDDVRSRVVIPLVRGNSVEIHTTDRDFLPRP